MTSQSIRPTQLHRCILLLALLVPFCSSGNAQLPQHVLHSDHHALAEEQGTFGSLPLPVKVAISADVGRDDTAYHFVPIENGGYVASNLAAGVSATVGPAGMSARAASHTWSLSLSSWGRGNDLKLLTEAGPGMAASNRLEYDYGALTEWYVNGPLGLQQGWTLTAPPLGPGNGHLTLSLTQGGTLRGHVDASSSTGLALADATGVERLRYGSLKAYDAKGRELPAWFESCGDQVLIEVDDADASYPVTIDPWLQACKLTTRPGVDEDHLAWSVAVSSDGDTVVVGVPDFDLYGSDQGAVYVYTRPGEWASTPLYTARLIAGDGAAGDNLGWSVSVTAGGDTVVAGAPHRGAGGSKRGVAYVFFRSSEAWQDAVQTAKLTAGDGLDNDELGTAVAVSGDGGTIIAGAPGGGGGARGAVYVYTRPSGGWSDASHTAKLAAEGGAAGDELGRSLASSGDGSVVVAGAPNYAAGSAALGAAFVYARPASGWADATETARLMSGDGYSEDLLGWSVAVSSDGGVVVAGAPLHDAQTVGDMRGAAYVYTEPSTGWATTMQFTAKLTIDDAGWGDGLGYAVAANGSGDTIIASAPYHYIAAEGAEGAVYVYARGPSGWSDAEQAVRLHATDGQDDDLFGWSVALSADGSTAIAGTPWTEVVPGGSERGAAYVFARPGSQWADATETAKLTADNGEDGDLLGRSVAVSGDGRTVVVGAPLADGQAGGNEQGAVYVYVRPAEGWTATATFSAKLTAGDGSDHDELGQAVAVSGNGSTVIAGAYRHPGGNSQGAAYVFTRPPGGWASTAAHDAKLIASDGADGDRFGESVAISDDGSTSIVGAPLNDKVYVYTQPPGGWVNASQTSTLTTNYGDSVELGRAVAISEDGSTVVSGAPRTDSAGCQGSVFVYTRPTSGWLDSTGTAELVVGDMGGGLLGQAVAVSGSGDTVVAGAPDADAESFTERGLVFVFLRPTGGWESTTAPAATLTVDDGAEEDHFGSSVAVNGDGSTVVAGASGHDAGANRSGAAYIYIRPASGWVDATQTTKLTAGDAVDWDMLGSSVATSADGYVVVAGAPSHLLAPGSEDLGAAYVYGFTTPPQFTSGTPPSPVSAGSPYSFTFSAVGVPTPAFSVSAGSLPPGLALDLGSGILSGTPTTPGNYTFTVTASNGVAPDATQEVTIVVEGLDHFSVYLPLMLRNLSGP